MIKQSVPKNDGHIYKINLTQIIYMSHFTLEAHPHIVHMHGKKFEWFTSSVMAMSLFHPLLQNKL